MISLELRHRGSCGSRQVTDARDHDISISLLGSASATESVFLSFSHPSSLVEAATVTPLHPSYLGTGWQPLSDRGKLLSHQIPCSRPRFPHHFHEHFSSRYIPNRTTSYDPRPRQRYPPPPRLLPPDHLFKMCKASPPGMKCKILFHPFTTSKTRLS